MLSRLPTETLGGLKVGDAVMIVATQPAADSATATAVTLLAGVEPILQASPKGEMTLTPMERRRRCAVGWSVDTSFASACALAGRIAPTWPERCSIFRSFPDPMRSVDVLA